MTLDEWSDEQVEMMEAIGGNAAANAVYEAFIPPDLQKPSPDSSVEERSDFIRYLLVLILLSGNTLRFRRQGGHSEANMSL